MRRMCAQDLEEYKYTCEPGHMEWTPLNSNLTMQGIKASAFHNTCKLSYFFFKSEFWILNFKFWRSVLLNSPLNNILIFYSSWSMVIHEGMQVEAYNSESSVSFRIIQHLCRLSTTSKVFSNLSDSLRNILNRWMALLLQVQMNWPIPETTISNLAKDTLVL